MNKRELRSYIKQQFLLTTAEQRSAWSEEMCMAIRHDAKIKDAKCIMAFYPLADEVDIAPLLDEFCHGGKIVLLPVVVNDTDMTLRRYIGQSDMEAGTLNTKHPNGIDINDYANIDAILVPGQAFDHAGHRLGRGKGYYDRFLQQLHSVYTRAVCFPYQIVDEVPFEPHDIVIDHV